MSADDAEARLRARLADNGDGAEAEHPRTWNPRQGDPATLIGTLVSVVAVETRFGVREVAAIDVADGTRWAVWLSAKTIRRAWDQEAPLTGEVVAIKYGGDRATQDGQRVYPVFTLAVDRPTPAAGSPQ